MMDKSQILCVKHFNAQFRYIHSCSLCMNCIIRCSDTSTNQAWPCLASEIKHDWVCSRWYGHKLHYDMLKNPASYIMKRGHISELLASLFGIFAIITAISNFTASICTGFSESKELKWLKLVPLENVTKTIRNYSQIKKLWCNLAADNRIHRLLTSTLMFFWAMFTDSDLFWKEIIMLQG